MKWFKNVNSDVRFITDSLEQSEPWRPVSQEQSPEDVSQTPELLQSAGQVNSINKNHYDLIWRKLYASIFTNNFSPEQSEPWWPSLHVHSPIVKSQIPLPEQGFWSPGHDMSKKK